MNKVVKFIIGAVLLLALVFGIYYVVQAVDTRNKQRVWSNEYWENVSDAGFVQLLKPAPTTPPEENGDAGVLADESAPHEIPESAYIVRIRFDGYTWYGYTKDSASYSYWAIGPNPYTANPDWEYGESALAERGISIEFSDPNAGAGWSNLLYIGVLVMGVILIFIVLRSTSMGDGKVMSFGRTKARITTNIKVRFSDVAGAEEEKEELAEVVEFLRNPKKFSELGARIPKGVLLVGPPGTGKTLFARAVAGEAGVPFFSVSGSDFVEMYVGVGASRVRDLFDLAKRNQPCIIFIDEIDAVGRQRGAGLGGGHDEREQTLNQILVQMDGFETNEGVIVMAATNRADILDNALLRPGRFDRQIYVHLPDVKGREQILKVHSRNKPLAPDVNFKVIARITSGFSGADLANLLNEAAILAARAGKTLIGNLELYEGINKVILGPQKKSRVVTEQEKKLTAYHESGHAILGKLCHELDNVQEVSIIPRGPAGGYTLYRPESDNNLDTVGTLRAQICSGLGGRVAEEIVLHDVSSGASGDIRQVTALARKMVTEWGMSDRLGPIAYSSDGPVFIGRDFEERATYSEETAGIIDEEVKRIISEEYARATKLLTEHRSILDNMARVLVERETIYTAEVDLLMKGADYKEVLAYMEEHDKGEPDVPFGENAEKAEPEKAPEEPQDSEDKH